MTSRLSKEQLLDGLKHAGAEIPANASSSRLRELYDNVVVGNFKEAGEPSVSSETSTAATASSGIECLIWYANLKLEVNKSQAKANNDVKPNDARYEPEVKHNSEAKSDVKTRPADISKESQLAVTAVVASTQDSVNEAANLDLQLDILRKKHELLKLQHAIADLENGGLLQTEVTQVSTPHVTSNRLTFRDIEHTIAKFDGENRAYGVYDFLRNFDRVMNMVAADKLFKYTSLCNSLTGTARLLLNRTDVISYAQLKAALVKEFGRAINRGEIYKILSNYKWNKKDNLRRYVLEMENIASRCDDIDEFELIGFIISGMQDNTPEAYLLMNARTLDQFKESLDLYEQRRASRPVISRVADTPNKPMMTKRSAEATSVPSDTANIRCYNCTQMGHFQSKCPYDKRPDGSCFRCWQMGHDHRNCTYPKKLLTQRKREIAAVSSDNADVRDDFYEDTISAVNNVSIAFCDSEIKCRRFMNCFSLFDTGSPTNFVKRSYVPHSVNNTAIKSKYRGLGQYVMMTYGTTEAKIKFRNQCEKIVLNIVPDTTMSIPLILGREFLNKFNIHLYKKLKKEFSNKCTEFLDENRSFFCALDLNREVKPRSQSAVSSDVEKIISYNRDYLNRDQITRCKLNEDLGKGNAIKSEILCEDEYAAGNYCDLESILFDVCCVYTTLSDVDVNPNLSQEHFENLRDVIYRNYLEANDIEVKPYAYEMNIKLTSDTPFHFLPRRLSYYERGELRNITDKLVENNIIRPSESPYASAVVLVKKKNGEIRKCVDYRALNKLTIRDNFPLPLIEDCIEYLGGKKYFTTIDLKNGFFHVKMASDSIKYTSFVTPYGQFEYLRMPFGLKNAPAKICTESRKNYKNLEAADTRWEVCANRRVL
ncbi:uncharacterized protein LOC135949365 [Calliphora vicina]|uniref:uncharacterized protein LOC135949365 n=1 Tax=Calliphora vicina TaxID=7373 RepID=UPI00325AEE45